MSHEYPTVTPRWLVLADEDFGQAVHLSRVSDMYECEAEADYAAEEVIRGGSRFVYVFRLESCYVPQGSRFVEVRQVELQSAKHAPMEGYGGTD